MKKIIFLFILVVSGYICKAQQADMPVQPGIGCIDKDLLLLVDDVKHGFLEKGMKVYKDAMVSMESDVPYSIEVQLTKGHQYQFIYMGSDASTRSSMELYDGTDDLVEKKQLKHAEEPGYITFSYMPEKTDIYLIMLMQRQKHASMCGSITILENK